MELICDSDTENKVLFYHCSHKHCFGMLISSYRHFYIYFLWQLLGKEIKNRNLSFNLEKLMRNYLSSRGGAYSTGHDLISIQRATM